MKISLQKPSLQDANIIYEMQKEAFMHLLKKYKDYETSPANEPLERIELKLNQEFTDFYLIKSDCSHVGAIRVVHMISNLRLPIIYFASVIKFGLSIFDYAIL